MGRLALNSEWRESLPGRFIPTERAYGTNWRMLYFNLYAAQIAQGV